MHDSPPLSALRFQNSSMATPQNTGLNLFRGAAPQLLIGSHLPPQHLAYLLPLWPWLAGRAGSSLEREEHGVHQGSEWKRQG